MAGVNFTQVDKKFAQVQVLEDISVDVNDGEFMVLVGPSGCGKSTLLRMVAGIEDITAGTIAINGRTVNDLPPKERDIAMVFQNYALFPHLSVADNMAFSMMLAKAPKADRIARVKEAARMLDLTDLLDRKPRQLSGGQRQRVAMGRALVRDPQVFLFDEPLSNLDAKLRVAMRAEIRTLQQRLGTTSIYVTHDQVEAMTMADRIVVINQGRVEQIGTPLELYDYPDNLFVAGFIGSPAMNLVAGDIVDRQGERFIQFDNGWSIPIPETTRVKIGDQVTYGVRPENCVPASDGVVFTIDVVEQMGSETQLVLTRGAIKLVASVRERLQAKPGASIALRTQPENSLLFDTQTGQRL